LKILIISFSLLERDPRVFRQIRTLANEHEISTVGIGEFSYKNVKHHAIRKKPTTPFALLKRALLLMGRFYDSYHKFTYPFHECLTELDEEYDIIIANDVEAFPFAAGLKAKKRFVFDLHEYAPRQFENNLFWRILVKPFNTYILRTYLDRADILFTVGEGIAREYLKVFGREPYVLTNAREYHETDKRQAITTENKKIRLIHHGVASPSRKLEQLIQMMDYLDDEYELTLMLVPAGSRGYFDKLKSMAEKRSNVVMRPPVSMQDIVHVIEEYDIGVYSLPPLNFNQEYALPNKIFEFIQARLAVVIGPSEEMADLVRKYKIGRVANSFRARDIASAVRSLSGTDIAVCKNNCDKAAKEVNAEVNMEEFKRLVLQEGR